MPQWVHMRPEKAGSKLDHTYYPQATSRCLNKYPGMAVNPLG
jgi:hypothetical protein